MEKRPIKDMPGYYITDDGRVWSDHKKGWKDFKYVNGYPSVILYKDNHGYNFLVHRLVAEAFIPNPNNYP